MKKLAFLVLALLALSLTAALGEFALDMSGFLGEPVEDFTVETIDGAGFTLSEALKDHDMVLINLWASWCEPCEEEFPGLQAAWEAYSDRVSVVALSVEEADSDEVLQAYAAAHGLTFPMGRDTAGLADRFEVYTIPCTVVVDRFGNAAFSAAGAQTGEGDFERLFDAFTSDDYVETKVLDAIPAAKPDVEIPDSATLSAAANAPGGDLVFTGPADGDTWPMTPVTEGEREALASTNSGHLSTSAAVYTRVEAAEGDALAFDFRTSTEGSIDLMEVLVDGQAVKAFGGEHDWTAWAIPLAAGGHEIDFVYSTDDMVIGGEDRVWIDNVRVASGDEAAALLADVSAGPVADAVTLTLTGEGATELRMEDPEGIMLEYFGCDSFWVMSDDTAHVEITLTEAVDPERAMVYESEGDTIYPMNRMLKADGSGYAASIDISSLKESEDGFTTLVLYPGMREEDLADMHGAMLFADENTAVSILSEILAPDDEEGEDEANLMDEDEYADAVGLIDDYDVEEADENAAGEADEAKDEDAAEEAAEVGGN